MGDRTRWRRPWKDVYTVAMCDDDGTMHVADGGGEKRRGRRDIGQHVRL